MPADIFGEIEKEALKTKSEEELKEFMDDHCSKDSALKQFFIFSETEKGHTYWWGIYEKYLK